MHWPSCLIGLFLGVLVGIVLLAGLQFIRERRDDGDDFVEEIEALGLAPDDSEARYIQRLRAENRALVEKIIGKGD